MGLHQYPGPPLEKAQVVVKETHDDRSSDASTPSQVLPGWKPHTLRPPLLIAVIVCLLGLIATLEYLSRLSEQRGFLTTGCNGFSAGSTFTFLYLPTIFSVFLSLSWSWIDLDAKRLEPYFQMSKPEGASAEESLDLHYPFDFVALAPVKAIRNRHWAVAASGSAMLAIFWLLTPLIGAVFSTKTVSVQQQRAVTYESSILTPEKQVEEASNRFLTMAYKHIWAEEPLPAFTTARAALLPFELAAVRTDSPQSDVTWSAPTKSYFTTLACRDATVTENGSQYDNGNGCTLRAQNFAAPTDNGTRLLYVGYWPSLINDYYLSGEAGCKAESNKQVFFAMMKGTIEKEDVVRLLFCEPSYWQQNVKATVLRSNRSVIDVEASGPPFPLPASTFNSTNFEYMMNAQTQQVSKRADIIDTSVFISHAWRLRERWGARVDMTTPLMALALATTQLPIKYYMNTENLVKSLENAHQLLFALAFREILSPNASGTSNALAIESYNCQGITIVRRLAILVECVTGLVICLTGCMIYVYGRRRSEMVEDPRSIRDVLNMLEPGSNHGECSKSSLLEQSRTSVRMYRGVVRGPAHQKNREETTSSNDEANVLPISTKRSRKRTANTAGSWELSKLTGSAFLFLLVAATTAILTCNALIKARDGLPRPSHNEAINQLVTNYLPVAFVNILEPFWTLLNRLLCVFRPFQLLANRDVQVNKSLDLRYTSLPPQLAFWRALRIGDFALVLVCAIGLSTNILAVAFSGLFTSTTVSRQIKTSYIRRLAPLFEQTLNMSTSLAEFDSGVLLSTASTFMNGAVQPPWIWNDTFFVPFELSAVGEQDPGTTFTAQTYGFASDVSCDEISYDASRFVSTSAAPPSVLLPSGRNCSNIDRSAPQGGLNLSRMAAEVSNRLSDGEDIGPCAGTFLAGFMRGNLSLSINLTKTDNSIRGSTSNVRVNELNATWMACEQRLRVAQYLVTIDSSARIYDAARIGSDIHNKTQFFAPRLNETYFMAQSGLTFTIGRNLQSWWHSDTYTDSWFGYLIKLVNPNFTDPSQPVPDFLQAQDAVKAVWKRMFAVQLSMNQQWLQTARDAPNVDGVRTTKETVIKMSQPAFVICMTLMVANIGAAISYYCLQRPRLERLPRMPITIGRTFELFEGSSLLADRSALKSTTRVGYGRFIGTDSQDHVGVDRSERLSRGREHQ